LAIRENWEKPGAAVPKALESLGEVLGLALKCAPEWPLLSAALGPVYEENADHLVGAVAGLVQIFCEALTRLINEASDEWTDELLEKLKDGFGQPKLCVDVSICCEQVHCSDRIS
jgi:hypothetical protein